MATSNEHSVAAALCRRRSGLQRPGAGTSANDPLRTYFPSDVPDHELIERAIRELHALGVRIFNVSITDRDPLSGPHVSLMTEIIDRLALELNVVVVVAAGNRPIAATGELGDNNHALRLPAVRAARAHHRLPLPR